MFVVTSATSATCRRAFRSTANSIANILRPLLRSLVIFIAGRHLRHHLHPLITVATTTVVAATKSHHRRLRSSSLISMTPLMTSPSTVSLSNTLSCQILPPYHYHLPLSSSPEHYPFRNHQISTTPLLSSLGPTNANSVIIRHFNAASTSLELWIEGERRTGIGFNS